MEGAILQGIFQAIQPLSLLATVCGVIFGLLVGMIPGLTVSSGIIMVLPLTFTLSPILSVALLLGVYVAGFTGGAFSAILINIPGTASAAATLLDGYPMAQRGEAARGLGIAITASLWGGLFSFVCLALLAPQLAGIALKFRAPELFALIFFGLSIISSFAVTSVVKGLLSAVIGLIIVTVGQDPIRGMGRFTFGSPDLLLGVHFLPALVGLFAFPEFVNVIKGEATQVQKKAIVARLGRILPTWPDLKTMRVATLVGSVVGTFIGFLPGAGGPIAVFMAYDYIRKLSKTPEKFGTGCVEGIAATESSNSSVCGGALIPTMTLGIPGDPITAIIIGALLVHGLTPGPLLFITNAPFAYGMIASFFCATIFTAIIAFTGIRIFVKVVTVPKVVLLPVILICCYVGSYALRNSMFDVYLMFGFGILSLLMKWLQIPVVPMLLALVLGQQLEEHLRIALTISRGDISVLFTSPISLFFLCLSAVSIAWPFVMQRKKEAAEAGQK
ncbi:MAG: tripartite tricarboxylate transporter permease [Smithellaceae bacterium]|nr:tripartite tricarboxylate transporter permease [Smithellaceae bacterium]